jgi:hypothetical protein
VEYSACVGLGFLAAAVTDHVAGNPIPRYVPLAGLDAADHGVLAGVYPAVRAACFTPAHALRRSG